MKKGEKQGTVALIGAGPGHPGLITRLGYDLMQQSDAVVYDDLISDELIVPLIGKKELFYVGKRSGFHSNTQDEINELLVDLAKSGKNVSRLKGGDPLIFGRVGEEIRILQENNISFSIIPGITAGSAAAAGSKFSLTDRRSSSWVMMATGHEAESTSKSVSWKEIGDLKGGTIVVYMGVGQIERIVCELQNSQMNQQTSVVVAQNASTGQETSFQTSLKELLHKCKSNSVKPPALFIIGGSAVINTDSNENVCKLKGKRILITGPYQNTDRISKLIRERRAEPVIYPTITLKRYYDMGAWKRVKGIVDKGGWIVFTSKMGVKEFFSQLLSAGMDYRVLGKFKFATVGDKTTNILREYGFKSDLMPKDFLATELISRMRRVKNIFNKVVVLVKGNLNDDTLSTELTKAGADIYPLQVYDNHPAHWEPQWIRKIIDHPPDYVVFSSGSTVEGLISIFGMEEALKLTERVKVVSIGPKTTEVAEANNIRVNLESEIHNMEGVLDAIGKYEENRI